MVNGLLEKALGECQGDRQMLNRIANLNKQRHLASGCKTSQAEPLAIRVTGPSEPALASCSQRLAPGKTFVISQTLMKHFPNAQNSETINFCRLSHTKLARLAE